MQAVILAAGKGTRLHPVTADRCKALAPVGGVPVIGRLVDRLVDNSIRDFVVVVRDGERELRHYLQSRLGPGPSLRFVVQKDRRGTGHALGLAAPLLDGDFLLLACDSLVPSHHIRDLLNAFEGPTNAALSLMEVAEVDIPSKGIVDWRDGRVERIVEKPTLDEAPSNMGSLPIYVLSSRLLTYLPEIQPSPRGELELPDAIQLLIERDGEVTGVCAPGRDELTTVEDLLALNARYLRSDLDNQCDIPSDLQDSARWTPPVRVDAGVRIGADCEVGPDVYLERGCKIGEGSRIKNAVILRGSRVPGGSVVEDRVFLELD